ncbi:hypothetical protein [Sorangium sp. So ce406]|uniref:hypothetical protein n=1 Tax=Sorangium sp. So ce406 TaxID=3133311 RepID=UPI003F5B5A9A
MSVSAWPRPTEILDHDDRLREALRALDRQFSVATTDPRSTLFGLSRDEFDDRLTRTLEELDAQTVLTLTASAEATIRRDFEARLHRRTKDAMRRRFKQLRERYAERVALDDILEAWKDEHGNAERIGRFEQLVLHRHWLAHGRYWSNKSGIAPDPLQAHLVIDDLFRSLTDHLTDFPLA